MFNVAYFRPTLLKVLNRKGRLLFQFNIKILNPSWSKFFKFYSFGKANHWILNLQQAFAFLVPFKLWRITRFSNPNPNKFVFQNMKRYRVKCHRANILLHENKTWNCLYLASTFNFWYKLYLGRCRDLLNSIFLRKYFQFYLNHHHRGLFN